MKPAAASWDQEKKDAKACCKEDGKKECKKEVAPKVGSKANDPTLKNKTPEIGVPPTPNKTKSNSSSSSTTTTSGTTK